MAIMAKCLGISVSSEMSLFARAKNVIEGSHDASRACVT